MAKKTNKRISFQEWVEQNVWGLALATALVVSVGGIVEIVPLFYLENTFEDDVFLNMKNCRVFDHTQLLNWLVVMSISVRVATCVTHKWSVLSVMKKIATAIIHWQWNQNMTIHSSGAQNVLDRIWLV